MWQKILASVIVTLTKDFATWAFSFVSRFIKRKKRVKKSEEVAQRIEDAKTPDEVRASIDDLP